MFLSDVLGGLLRPARCLACGAPGAWPCCASCLPPTPDDVGPWPLAADPEVPLWALGPYRDALRAAVLAGKLDDQPAALTELGGRLGDALAAAGVGADLVTYVAAARVAGPPRDHAQQIATGVAAALELPMVGLLAPAGGRDLGRARRTGRPDRRPPPRPPPAARHRLAGGRILLIDDLATTGGTLAGAAATLRHAGARHVEAAVLAAAPTALGPPGPGSTSDPAPGRPLRLAAARRSRGPPFGGPASWCSDVPPFASSASWRPDLPSFPRPAPASRRPGALPRCPGARRLPAPRPPRPAASAPVPRRPGPGCLEVVV
jgi:predicted amidophosphoribosyltransferase